MKDKPDQNWRRDHPPKIERSRAYHHYLAMAAEAEAMRKFVEADSDAEQVSPRLHRQ
jgi:hypothetical protein